MFGVGLSSLAAFFVTLLSIFALRPFAGAIDLIDRPGGHKTHHGNVPIVGGIAMFIGIVLGLGLLSPTGGYFLAASAVLVTVGLLDDRFNLSPWTRLPVQVAAALVFTVGWGGVVTTLGGAFGTEITLSGWVSHAFTVAMVVGGINAFNMLDGMDGLAGALAGVAFLGFIFLGWAGGVPHVIALGCVLFAVVAAFMVFSLPLGFNRSVRCFMGDAGSTVLGFAAAWLAVDISQAPASAVAPAGDVAPVTVLWVVALPLYELVWSTLRRILRGDSPFKGDRAHFHHLLLDAGFSVRGAFAIFLGLGLLLASFGVVSHFMRLAEHVSLMLFGIVGVLVIRFMYSARLLLPALPMFRRDLRLKVEEAQPDSSAPAA